MNSECFSVFPIPWPCAVGGRRRSSGHLLNGYNNLGWSWSWTSASESTHDADSHGLTAHRDVNGIQSLSSLDAPILRRAQREDAGDEEAAQQQPGETSPKNGGVGDAGTEGRQADGVPEQKNEGEEMEDATEGAGEKEDGGGRRGRRKNRVAPEEKEGENAAAHEGGPIERAQAQGDGAPSAKGIDIEAPWNREEAVKEALANRERNEPRVPNKEVDGYSGLSGGKFPLTAPSFSADRPNLGDFGVGISLYIETLRVFSLVFFAMFLLGIPSLVLTFAANPDAVSSREGESWRESESGREIKKSEVE